MKTRIALLALSSLLLTVPAFAAPADDPATTAPAVPAPDSDTVQIAILLDTSNSMDGLIAQAKAQLWQVVNVIAKSQVENQRHDIQVALYQYGTPSLGRETGYIRQCVPLTDDLDKVSEALFRLSTNGGDEYCGWVLKDALHDLKWSADKNAYKAIFIAGNEPFTQGPVDFAASCKEAVTRGIIVHTIFCGAEPEGIRTAWKDGATLGQGTFSFINQTSAFARNSAPQDKELADLGTKLNATYVPYGINGQIGAANQSAQDRNAGGLGGLQVAAERAITKSTSAYKNAAWDLVDAVKSGTLTLQDLKPEDLPPEMRALDPQGRADFLAAKLQERQALQARIRQLSDEREQYLAALPPTPSPTNVGARGTTAAGAGAGGGGRGGGGGGGGGSLGGAMGRAMGGR